MPGLFGTHYSRAELLRWVGRLEQVAGVRLVTLGDGQGRGVRVLEFRTGTGFAFDVVVDRSFDVGRCELGGRPLSWQSAQLPHHTVWRMMGEGTYALGLEPSTNRDAGRWDARERGELQWLGPGEQRRYDPEIGALNGLASIGEFEARVSRLAASPSERSGS